MIPTCGRHQRQILLARQQRHTKVEKAVGFRYPSRIKVANRSMVVAYTQALASYTFRPCIEIDYLESRRTYFRSYTA